MGKGCRSEIRAPGHGLEKQEKGCRPPFRTRSSHRSRSQKYRNLHTVQYIPGIPSMRRRFETKQGEEKMQGKRFEGQTSTLLDVEDFYASSGTRCFACAEGESEHPLSWNSRLGFEGCVNPKRSRFFEHSCHGEFRRFAPTSGWATHLFNRRCMKRVAVYSRGPRVLRSARSDSLWWKKERLPDLGRSSLEQL